MKKLFLLLIFPLLMACSSDDDNDDTGGKKQDYTSFQVKSEAGWDCENVVAGYKLDDGNYKRIAVLGNIEAGKSSQKITIDQSIIRKVELFCDARDIDGNYSSTRPVAIIEVVEKQNNIFIIPNKLMIFAEVDKDDPTQYPIE